MKQAFNKFRSKSKEDMLTSIRKELEDYKTAGATTAGPDSPTTPKKLGRSTEESTTPEKKEKGSFIQRTMASPRREKSKHNKSSGSLLDFDDSQSLDLKSDTTSMLSMESCDDPERDEKRSSKKWWKRQNSPRSPAAQESVPTLQIPSFLEDLQNVPNVDGTATERLKLARDKLYQLSVSLENLYDPPESLLDEMQEQGEVIKKLEYQSRIENMMDSSISVLRKSLAVSSKKMEELHSKVERMEDPPDSMLLELESAKEEYALLNRTFQSLTINNENEGAGQSNSENLTMTIGRTFAGGPLACLLIADISVTAHLIKGADKTEEEMICSSLTRIFSANGFAEELLNFFINDVVKSVDQSETATLFRLSSPATFMIKSYRNLVGAQLYLAELILPPLREVRDSTGELEVDPDRMTDAPEGAIEENAARLLSIVNSLIKRIYSQVELAPMPFRRAIHLVYEAVETKFEGLGLLAVGGFVWLRFICPGILVPDSLVESAALVAERSGTQKPEDYSTICTPEGSRGLKLVGKIMQNLSNGTKFHEPYMLPFNKFLEEHMEGTNDFLERFAMVGKHAELFESSKNDSTIAKNPDIEVTDGRIVIHMPRYKMDDAVRVLHEKVSKFVLNLQLESKEGEKEMKFDKTTLFQLVRILDNSDGEAEQSSSTEPQWVQEDVISKEENVVLDIITMRVVNEILSEEPVKGSRSDPIDIVFDRRPEEKMKFFIRRGSPRAPDHGIYVTRVASDEEPWCQMRPGDRVLKLNSMEVDSMLFADVVKLMKSLSGQIELVIEHLQDPSAEDAQLIPFSLRSGIVIRYLRHNGRDVTRTWDALVDTLAWRQENKVDRILRDWTPQKTLVDYFPGGLHKEDRKGYPVFYSRLGRCDFEGLISECGAENVIRYQTLMLEKSQQAIYKAQDVIGRRIHCMTLVLDLSEMTLDITKQGVIQTHLEMVAQRTKHYPEIFGHIIVLRAPRLYHSFWNVLRSLVGFSNESIRVLGRSDELALFDYIAPENVPSYLGGQCSCDGSPECVSQICPGGPVPRADTK